MKELTIIIAEHNEGDQLLDTLLNLYETSDPSLYNVIVVSDGSDIDAPDTGNETRIKFYERKGVGAAFDRGMKLVETPYAIIMGSDIRFKENGYIEKMLTYVKRYPQSIICTANVGVNPQKMDFDRGYRRYGAFILPFLTAEDLPPKGSIMARLREDKATESYRNILESKWMPAKEKDEIYQLPCVLGAFYGINTYWYKMLRGFRGHRYWGTLEPFISLKSWFAGGDCMCAPDIEVAHIFKGGSNRPSHTTLAHDLLYNKLAISRILFSEDVADKFINFLKGRPQYTTDSLDMQMAEAIFEANRDKIYSEREKFRDIQTRDIYWYKKKFPFKHYDVI